MKTKDLSILTVRLALRNIALYKFKTVVVASLLGSGAFLAVLGLSLLHSVENSMQESIIESVSGHLQVYSDKAKDELSLFGSGFMGRDDVGTLSDFAPYRNIILQHPNVEAFIPMGIDTAILGRGNEMDELLDALRKALKSGENDLIKDRKDQVRFQIEQLKSEIAEKEKIYTDKDELAAQKSSLNTALAPDYLNGIKADDEEKLQFLEAKIAPLSGEKQPVYLSYLGTDPSLHRKYFAKYKVVEGENLPEGQRGIMLSKKIRETQLKNQVGLILDRLHKRTGKQGIKIQGDPENERDAANLPLQYAQIISLVNRNSAILISDKLLEIGIAPSVNESDIIQKLTSQIKSFLTVTDENLQTRYNWFYENIAPHIRLYEISPGETITIRSYTRSGYIKSVPIKVYGVYTFEGLEDSDIAGAMNIIDLISFRELFGQMNSSSQKELDEIRANSGIKEISAEDAENTFFGEASQTKNLPPSASQQKSAASVASEPLQFKQSLSSNFPLEEIQSGLALSGAIKLKDSTLIKETEAELKLSLKKAGLEARVIDWQKASGLVGQFILIVRLVLIFAMIVIFAVALVIINNSIVVSTFNRQKEIGTMRAIGAQKSFVLSLFLAEVGITGFLSSILGTLFAVLLLFYLGKTGIPAGTDVVAFLFSGPRLLPTIRWPVVFEIPIIVTVIATLTSFYAARHAAHITPSEAMQEKE